MDAQKLWERTYACRTSNLATHRDQVSILPTFYEQLFLRSYTYIFVLEVWIYIFFWCKKIGSKAACKMLVKLTTDLQESSQFVKNEVVL